MAKSILFDLDGTLTESGEGIMKCAVYALAHYGAYTVTFYTFAFAGVGSLIFLQPSQLAVLARPAMALTAIGMVAISTVLPYLLYTGGLARMDSAKASMLASVEPVVAALAGVIVFHERMSPATGLGAVSILAAVLLLH